MELQSRTSGAAKLLESQELHQWGSKALGAMKRGEHGAAKPKLREPQELHQWSRRTTPLEPWSVGSCKMWGAWSCKANGATTKLLEPQDYTNGAVELRELQYCNNRAVELREPQELHRWSLKTSEAAKRGERGAVQPLEPPESFWSRGTTPVEPWSFGSCNMWGA